MAPSRPQEEDEDDEVRDGSRLRPPSPLHSRRPDYSGSENGSPGSDASLDDSFQRNRIDADGLGFFYRRRRTETTV